MNVFTDVAGVFVAVEILDVRDERGNINFPVIVFRQVLVAQCFAVFRHA